MSDDWPSGWQKHSARDMVVGGLLSILYMGLIIAGLFCLAMILALLDYLSAYPI